MIGMFMQLTSILQLPIFLGPSFSPFNMIGNIFVSSSSATKKAQAATRSLEKEEAENGGSGSPSKQSKGKKGKQKKS